jgi:hypothetical protein
VWYTPLRKRSAAETSDHYRDRNMTLHRQILRLFGKLGGAFLVWQPRVGEIVGSWTIVGCRSGLSIHGEFLANPKIQSLFGVKKAAASCRPYLLPKPSRRREPSIATLDLCKTK